MFILANFLLASAAVVEIILTLMMWLIFIRAILSWVSPDPFNPIVSFFYQVTEPILTPIRRLIPSSFGRVDLSAMIAFFLIIFLQNFLVPSLRDLASHLR